MSWPAKYRGVCAECGGGISEGDDIDWANRGGQNAGTSEIRHANLAECVDVTVPKPAPGDRVCPRCTSIHPGEC